MADERREVIKRAVAAYHARLDELNITWPEGRRDDDACVDAMMSALAEVSQDEFSLPKNLVLKALEILRLNPIYALMGSPYEAELGEDFKRHKWEGFEQDHAEESLNVYKSILTHLSPGVIEL